MDVISNDGGGEPDALTRSCGRAIDLRNLPHLFAILYISPREESFYLHELCVLKGILLNPESSQTTYHARRFHLALFRPALIPRLSPLFFLILLLRSFILSNGTIYSISRVALSFGLSVPLSFFFPLSPCFSLSLSLSVLFPLSMDR